MHTDTHRLVRIEQRLSIIDSTLVDLVVDLDERLNQMGARLAHIQDLVTVDLETDLLSVAQEAQLMTDLTALVAEVEANGDAVDSAVVLLTRLADELEAAGTDADAIAAVVEQLRSNSTELADAVVANTPAAPEPTDPTEPPVDEPVPTDEPV